LHSHTLGEPYPPFCLIGGDGGSWTRVFQSVLFRFVHMFVPRLLRRKARGALDYKTPPPFTENAVTHCFAPIHGAYPQMTAEWLEESCFYRNS